MKRKLVSIILSATLAVSMLSGCGGGSAETSAPAAEEVTESEAADEPEEEEYEEEEAVEEEAVEEEAADDSSDSEGSFSLLDVDENMVDVGAYGSGEDGTEYVFTMFTGPDNNKYVSLIGFDNNSNSGDVICGQYEATTETDEDGDEWTYFDVTDVYTGNHFNLGVCERPETEEVAFFDEDGNVVEAKFLSASETINYMGSAAALLSGDAE
ncbi:MAG TPA: hypothetical protein DIS78_06480 [Lachnospiraceae bacterium]|nr:hypothetical protein [Lachnospiraceae bacterium]